MNRETPMDWCRLHTLMEVYRAKKGRGIGVEDRTDLSLKGAIETGPSI